jgi:hypothetical protein
VIVLAVYILIPDPSISMGTLCCTTSNTQDG